MVSPVLEVRALEKRYGRVRAVRGVDLTVERGSIYGLIGPNGSGKTTTMGCALGLLRPDAGEVRVLGRPSARIHETLGRVAAMFDAPTLVAGLGVRQNLEYARRLFGHSRGRGVDEALDLVGIADLADQRAGGLSLGQSRRLSIARVLLGSPELVVLDEPLSGLDTVGVMEVLALFRRLAEAGITLVLSSHQLYELESVVTDVGVILDGQVVREGPLEDLLAGGERRLRVTAAPVERALEVCRRLDGVASVEPAPGRPEELLVSVPEERVPALARALVEAGLDVSGLVPDRATLQAVFEELIARRAGASP